MVPKPRYTVTITENPSTPISIFTHLPSDREPRTTLCAAAPLYNPRSRNVRAAPRFSPTRFIPLVEPTQIIL
jgi:hypothetical protein